MICLNSDQESAITNLIQSNANTVLHQIVDSGGIYLPKAALLELAEMIRYLKRVFPNGCKLPAYPTTGKTQATLKPDRAKREAEPLGSHATTSPVSPYQIANVHDRANVAIINKLNEVISVVNILLDQSRSE